MIHPDLPDGNFILGSRFQNCAWQTDVVVEIAFGPGDLESSRQHGRSKILCARLAIASGDREDFQRERPPVMCCEHLVGLQRIGRPEKCEIVRNTAPPVEINESAWSAGVCTGFDKLVAIEIFAA